MDWFARDKDFLFDHRCVWSGLGKGKNGCVVLTEEQFENEKKEEKGIVIDLTLSLFFSPFRLRSFVRLLLFSPWTLQLLIICACARVKRALQRNLTMHRLKQGEERERRRREFRVERARNSIPLLHFIDEDGGREKTNWVCVCRTEIEKGRFLIRSLTNICLHEEKKDQNRRRNEKRIPVLVSSSNWSIGSLLKRWLREMSWKKIDLASEETSMRNPSSSSDQTASLLMKMSDEERRGMEINENSLLILYTKRKKMIREREKENEKTKEIES